MNVECHLAVIALGRNATRGPNVNQKSVYCIKGFSYYYKPVLIGSTTFLACQAHLLNVWFIHSSHPSFWPFFTSCILRCIQTNIAPLKFLRSLPFFHACSAVNTPITHGIFVPRIRGLGNHPRRYMQITFSDNSNSTAQHTCRCR